MPSQPQPLPGVHGPVAIANALAATTETELRARLRVLQAVVNSVADGIVVANRQGEMLLFNPAAEKIVGIGLTTSPPNDWTRQYGCFLSDTVTPYPMEELPLVRALRGEEVEDAEMFLRNTRRPYGVWVLVSGSPLRDESGTILGGVVLFRDVTEARAQQSKLEHTLALLQAVTEGTTDAVYVKDIHGRYLLMNSAGAKSVGVRVEGILGKDDRALFAPAVAETIMARDRQVLHSGTVQTYEDVLTQANVTRIFSSTKAPYRDPQQRIIGLVGISRDITANKQIQATQTRQLQYAALIAEVGVILSDVQPLAELLQRAAAAVASALAAVDVYLWTAAADGALLLQARAGAAHLSSAGQDERLGQTCLASLGESHQPLLRTLAQLDDPTLAAWLAQEAAHTLAACPLIVEEQVSGLLAILLPAAPAEDLQSALASLSHILAQSIERKRSVEQLQLATAELARSNRDLEQFAYVASHDLQAPLRMVASYCTLLRERGSAKLDATERDYLQLACEGARSMQLLIERLLQYARIHTHGGSLCPTDARAALQRALDNLGPALDEAKAVVHCDPLPIVQADGLQLVLVFQNLLSNALRYRSAQPLAIHISARREGVLWEFAVRDNGVGIAAQHQERIFGMFEHRHKQPDVPGMGMGLTICKRIVERHHGRIWVESEPGRGAAFFFTLPAVADAPEPSAREASQPAQ